MSQLFVMAKVHTAKYKEPETIHPFPHHYLSPSSALGKTVCCPIGKLYSGNVHLYKEMQSSTCRMLVKWGRKMFVAVGNFPVHT